jgi:hypothetical protein
MPVVSGGQDPTMRGQGSGVREKTAGIRYPVEGDGCCKHEASEPMADVCPLTPDPFFSPAVTLLFPGGRRIGEEVEPKEK